MLGVKLSKEIQKAFQISLNSEAALLMCYYKKVFWKCAENLQENIHAWWSALSMKCDFNKVGCNSIEIALRHGFSPLNLLHIFRTPFAKNTWRAASVSWEINFEKWEKIRLDHDENITITYFFAVEQIIIIKIWILRSHRQLDKK